MTDKLTQEQRSRNMAKVKSKNTLLELKVRKELYALGYRYRLHYDLPGKPDIVFVKKKIAVFINGCFWHQHGCKKSKLPESNKEFWQNKLERNRQRDEETCKLLENQKWKPVVLWECNLHSNFENEIYKLQSILC